MLDYNCNTLSIQNIPYFKEGLAVIIKKNNIKIGETTWFGIGCKSRINSPESHPSKVLPSSLVSSLQDSLQTMDSERTINILLCIGDYMAGWLFVKDLESRNA